MSLRDQIMAKPRLGDPVEVPEWDVTVYVRGLSPADIKAIAKKSKGETDDQGENASLTTICWTVAHGLVDEAGSRILSDEDYGWLSEQAFSLLLRLTTEIQTRTHGTAEAEVEEAEKN